MTAFDEAIEVLPWWVSWLGLFATSALAVATAQIAARGAIWMALRGYDPTAHWTERARRALPARGLSSLLLLVLPAMWGAFAFSAHGPAWAVSSWAAAALVAGLALAATIRIHFALAARVLPHPPGGGAWLTSMVALIVYLPLVPITALFAWLAPLDLVSAGGAVWALGLVAAFALALRGDTLHLARLLGVARPASARLRAIVAAASARSGRRPPACWEIQWSMANAFAFPLGDRLLFTSAIMRHLDDAELEAITAHELGHLSESRGVKALRLLAATSYLPLAASGAIYQSADWWGVVAAWGLVVIVSLGLKRLQRKMEERADDHAHAHQTEEGTYARALSRLHELGAIPAVMTANATHPDLYDRLTAMGAPPSYPRPAPPAMRKAGYLTLGAVSFVAATMAALLVTRNEALAVIDTEDRTALLLAVALDGLEEWEWGALADLTDDADAAIVLHRAAIAAAGDPDRAALDRARLIALYAEVGRCSDGRREYDELMRHPGEDEDEVALAEVAIRLCAGAPP